MLGLARTSRRLRINYSSFVNSHPNRTGKSSLNTSITNQAPRATVPHSNKMFEDAAKRRFDLVLFWSLDRLSREGVLETLQHLNRLTSYGVAYKSFTEQYFDSCGVFKDAVIAIMATVAKQERVKRSARTKAGLARVRAECRTLGRPGWELQSAQIARLRAQGLSLRAIGRELGVSE